MGDFAPAPKVFVVIPIDDAQEREALLLTQELRRRDFIVELITRGNMGKKMKKADKIGAKAVLMLGENEVRSGQVTIKKLADGSQQLVARGALAQMLKTL